MNPRPGSRFFYGWYIVTVAFFCNFMVTGTGFYTFNAFMEPLCATNGWTRLGINQALFLGGLASLLAQYMHGTIIMRLGPRRYMVIGAAFSGLLFTLMGMTHSFALFLVLFVALMITNGMFGGIVANTVVNNWFVHKRGTALGIAQVGMSLSGAVLPAFAFRIYRAWDLETAFLVLGIMLFCMSPVCLLVIRDKPEPYGLAPDGTETGPASSVVSALAEETLWSAGGALSTASFWKVSLSYALAMIGVVGVMIQLKPRFSDLGFPPGTALALMSATAFLGAVGKYSWGLLCDRRNPPKMAALMMLSCAAGLAFCLYAKSLALAVCFVAVFGFSMGGIQATLPIMVAHLFGRLSFTSISRFVALVLALQNTGYLFMGLSFRYTGSYNAAYRLFMAFFLVAAGLMYSVKRPLPKE